jgi:hypothetical protein
MGKVVNEYTFYLSQRTRNEALDRNARSTAKLCQFSGRPQARGHVAITVQPQGGLRSTGRGPLH